MSSSYTPDPDRYDGRMPYRRCGKWGLKLPAITLGCWWNFGGDEPTGNQRRMIWSAFDAGITHFDLANNYGPPYGSAERNVGRILKDLPRDELIISTKAGYDMWPGPYGEWGSRKYLLASLDQSLMRMGLDYVDIFYSHRFDPETPLEETCGALANAVQQGKALYVGISSYGPDQSRMASRLLREMGVPCLIHQPNYSIFNRWIEEGLQEVLEDEGIGSIAFSPLAQGLLTDKYIDGIPADSRAAKEHGALQERAINDANLAAIRELADLAKARGQSLAQMAVAWVLRGGRVTSVLVGASRVEQIEDNVAALANLDFADDELRAIDAICDRRTAAMR